MSDYKSAKAEAKTAKAVAKANRPFYKKKRYWLLSLVVIVILAVVAGGGGESTDEPTNTEKSLSSEKGGDKASPAPKPMKVDAGTVIKDYEQNEAAADGKYSGKVLEVSGVIEKVDTDFLDDEEYIIRVGAGGAWDFLTVDCPGQSADAVSPLNKGDDITVVGEFDDGGDLGVTLKDCVIR